MPNHEQAQWELLWMVFHGETRLDTFARIKKWGFSRRQAAEMIQRCEREPDCP